MKTAPKALQLGIVAIALAGCSQRESGLGPAELASDASTTDVSIVDSSGESDASNDTGATVADADANVPLDPAELLLRISRGKYLVDHVAACGDCHTPRGSHGEPLFEQYLSGNDTFVDLVPSDPNHGLVPAPNLTPDPVHGLGGWTDAQIKLAVTGGIDKDQKSLYPVMPYWAYHNMTDDDAKAIVAYLRAVPPVAHEVPPPQDLLLLPPVYLSDLQVPMPSLPRGTPAFDSAIRGRYLAANLAACITCHTPDAPKSQGGFFPIDVTKMFLGNRVFSAAALGLPSSFPVQIIRTQNLSPHAHGIAGWSAAEVATAIKVGIDRNQVPLCPPMPSGMMGAFGEMTDLDALDLGTYFTNLPPVDNGEIPNCDPTATSDAGADGAATDGAAVDGAPSEAGMRDGGPGDAPRD